VSDPAISVVLIFFDDERFLGEAIDSVLAQSEADWELLLCDDGSTDGSRAIANAAAAERPDRIMVLEHPGGANRGISATRNLGLAHTRGRYVAFLDSDDVWNPEKLAEQRAIAEAHPEVGLVIGASRYWWSWADGDDLPADRVVPIGAPGDRVYDPPALLHRLYPLGRDQGASACPSSFFARREMLDRVGGFESSAPHVYEDQAFLLKVYVHSPVYVSSACWDRYRRHPDAVTMTTGREAYLAARLEVLEWYGRYLDEQGISDPGVRAALDRAMWPHRHPRLAALRETAGRARAHLRRRLRSRGGSR
jgi:glycosyltransferase involved in cell wall biosynthesis